MCWNTVQILKYFSMLQHGKYSEQNNDISKQNYISINKVVEICNKYITDYNPDFHMILNISLNSNKDCLNCSKYTLFRSNNLSINQAIKMW